MFQHFDWDLTHQVLFLYILPSHHMNLRDQPWKMLILWCRTDICSYKFSAKVSLMLGNPFLVPSLCKLNHISLCFIQIITKSPANYLSLQGKQCFFCSRPGVLIKNKKHHQMGNRKFYWVGSYSLTSHAAYRVGDQN